MPQKDLQQSFDQSPVDTSLDESESKAFEENTEEYLEPKFDDLRKHPKKKSVPQIQREQQC